MNPAKLRCSRDVSELQGSKIEKRFRIRHLAKLDIAFAQDQRKGSRISKILLLLLNPGFTVHHSLKPWYISSGRQPTAPSLRGVFTP
jgi:hypothetical protein